jgi:4-amino-4-deoxy-L-arabinose transferase-like glycosyltransferase
MSTTLSSPRPPQPSDPDQARRSTGPERPRWELPGLAVLLVSTAGLYLWNLAATGFGNAFYAAAVQAGTTSWKAFFFGSLDSANLITVDKPPASLWVMELSGRIFGFSSWSMLAPQALMAVATVALMWAAVRRISGPGAGLLAGALLALTPVAALMFKYNNPDAFLLLLLVVACYFSVRALEQAGTRWILLAGLFVGFAFLAKELQAFLVLPGLALAYLWAAPTPLGRRIAQLLGAGLALVVGAGWWVLTVALWPAADRPWIGGSTDSTELGRAFGYNGLGRIFGGGGFGGRGGSAAPNPASNTAADAAREAAGRAFAGATAGRPTGFGGFGGQAGILRMFQTEVGGQVAWLLPAALILLLAGLWLTRRAPRTDLTRATLIMWGGWTVVGALVLSLMKGTFHSYYTLVLVPGIVGLVVVGGREVWRARGSVGGRTVLALTTAVTAVWSWELLDRTPAFLPWLRWAIVVLGVLAALAMVVPAGVRGRLGVAVAAVAVVVGAAGPAAYALETALSAHAGGGVSAGPTAGGGGFGRGGQAARGGRVGRPTGSARPTGGTAAATAGGAVAGAASGGGRGGPGGFGGGATSAQLTALLKGAGTTWSAATVGSSAAASLELSSSTAVMGIGGFTGSDPAPTLAQFQSDVANGQVHYFVSTASGGRGGGGFGGGRGGGVGSAITQWVQQHYTARTVGGESVYDLAVPTA